MFNLSIHRIHIYMSFCVKTPLFLGSFSLGTASRLLDDVRLRSLPSGGGERAGAALPEELRGDLL